MSVLPRPPSQRKEGCLAAAAASAEAVELQWAAGAAKESVVAAADEQQLVVVAHVAEQPRAVLDAVAGLVLLAVA